MAHRLGEGIRETRANDDTGGVLKGEGESLEFFSGPPKVRGVVVLEEIAITLALPSVAGFGASLERSCKDSVCSSTWLLTLESDSLKANRRKRSSARSPQLGAA
jgi:hypothetical protein